MEITRDRPVSSIVNVHEKTAIRYAASARALLGDAAEGPEKKIDGEPAGTMLGWRDAT
ncbi:hypothetical protein ACFRFL_36485 [Streptomyces sp. NPDC056708]|uniref:hypothetical protein n=1 Tax=unclassified Streptomyces TaxID=2593676 RepID=UPI0036837DE6